MGEIEIRDPEAIRRYLLQGLCLQFAGVPAPTSVRSIVEWAVEMAAEGYALPPLGFVADVGRIALAMDREPRQAHTVERAPPSLIRGYEDYVLGKLYSDAGFERAANVVRRLSGRDRNRGIAYLVHRIAVHAGFGGALVSPANVKSLLDRAPGQLLSEGWESLDRDGVDETLRQLYDDLIAKMRLTSVVLEPEDVFELEHGTALSQLAERVALRQVVHAAARMEALLPDVAPRPDSHHRDAPTQFFDEDVYPVGGFASISNRGSMESLLHSQLAYMETDATAERPDLFDIKFIRDELLYYSRDENEFLRRRRGFVIALQHDLIAARYKDPQSPFQRLILGLAFVMAAARKLQSWLSADALRIDLLLPYDGNRSVLDEEERVLRIVLRDFVETGVVQLHRFTESGSVTRHIEEMARRSHIQALTIGTNLPTQSEHADGLDLASEQPRLLDITAQPSRDSLEAWAGVLNQLLEKWM